jgi:DNA-binding transcriptional ArsR family regulator
MAEVLDRDSLKALSAGTRQDIIKLLERRPYTASELSKKLNKHVTTVSEHLIRLEKSGLISKKGSTNKWVYYELTGKGEKLFKPAYYSWVIILSLSVLALVFGLNQMYLGTASETLSESATVQSDTEYKIGVEEGSVETETDIAGIILIIIALIGFAYLAIRMLKR